MSNPITYPLDQSGVNPQNLVTGELHSVSGSIYRDYHFIVAEFSPLYVDNFKATVTVAGVTRPLVEDVDFSFTLPYVTGTRTYGKAMYGGITLHGVEENGIVTLQYQTVGGRQTADRLQVLTRLADMAYNPRTTNWELVADVPEALPPSPHYQDYDTFYGQDAVVAKLGEIVTAIAQNSSLTTEAINGFLSLIGIDGVGAFVKRTGDRMDGELHLFRDPVELSEATTKRYVDSNFVSRNDYQFDSSQYVNAQTLAQALQNKLDRAGGSTIGSLTLGADPVDDSHAATKRYVDGTLRDINSTVESLRTTVNEMAGNFIPRSEVLSIIDEVLLRMTSKALR